MLLSTIHREVAQISREIENPQPPNHPQTPCCCLQAMVILLEELESRSSFVDSLALDGTLGIPQGGSELLQQHVTMRTVHGAF